MEKVELINKLNLILAQEFEVDAAKIKPEANIKETLMLNSLDAIDMIAVIEYEFGVKIPAGEYAHIKIFSQLYDYMQTALKN
ncbi:MAG: acyl carrier protein [Salinivirgaceae bacterium]|jgi:acyl carrier protein|nr:acyl carrier protein [Salinivirgaceae bacterium]MBO7495030.1 acyl carrier protein [Salinivirgaceae bacterium]MBR5643852.1 acyl carrier protein [Salinivirgaceae bacterium]